MTWVDSGDSQHLVFKTDPDGTGVSRCGRRFRRPFYATDATTNRCDICRAYDAGQSNIVRTGDVATASVKRSDA